ncbi:hypothetical protein [Gemmatimonas groenlandica]|uniref:Uncharacterized protein n=1 Tax=Gemmatimonas groenlandica TaxID=2732249 RepID=A0A6M4IS72_9BACT|nr:hypothetical protein [Gemmatimonas groenlandica]QJR36589.1 hypothetical protein HKW67_14260 [Gemmatimonas groenlandica]
MIGWSACLCLVTQLAVKANQPVSSLDAWLVSRFQGSQLLADSMPTTASLAAESPLPRIEATRAGRLADTLYAIHFGVRLGTPALAVNDVVQLTGPTGTITPLSARIIARRAFRAPRRPGASSNADAAWRYGWSYQVVMPHRAKSSGSAVVPVARYRGWLLLSVKREEPVVRRR